MRTQIKLHLKRLISLGIAIALLLSTIGISGTIAHAAENDFEEVTLSLNSTVVNDSSITLYLCESVHYISIDDLCELTRCSKSVEDNIISVTQGFWRATFDVEEQLFDDGYQSVVTTILEVSEDEYAVPALMFLSYFKAIAFIENDTLYCRMTEFTAWEALNVDYSNSLVDIYELYGGEGNVTFSLTLDIIMDFIMGDMSTSDDYLSDAFLEALKVDLYDYSSVQKYKESSQSDLYSDLHSDKGEEFVEAIEDTLGVAAEPTQWYIQYYYNAIEKSFVSLAYDAFEAGQHADVKHYGEKFYEAFTEKNKTSETAEKYFDNADYVMLFVSAAVDTAQQMKYTNATNNLVYNVMGQKNLNYLGISADDNDWFTVANRYQNVLGVAATQIEAEAMQLFTDKLCWETLIGTGVSSAAGISGGAWTFSLNFARLFVENFPLTSSSVEAFKADRRALYLSELQQNVYWVAMNTLQNMQGQWDNPEIYTKYIQALQLYCRTSIAMYENLITMVDEFGQDRDYWTSLFQARIDMLAVSLYQLTTFQDDGVNSCLPLDLASSMDNFRTDFGPGWSLNENGLLFLTEKPSANRPSLFTFKEYTIDGYVYQGERGGYGIETVYPSSLGTIASFYGDFSHSGNTTTFTVRREFNDSLWTDGLWLKFDAPHKKTNIGINAISIYSDRETYYYIIDGETTAYLVCESVEYDNVSMSGDSYYYKTALDAEREITETIKIINLTDYSKHIFTVEYNEGLTLFKYSEEIDYWSDIDVTNNLYYGGYTNEGKYTDVSQAVEYIQKELAKYGLADRVFSKKSMLKNYTPVLTTMVSGVPKTVNKATMEDLELQGKALIGFPTYNGAWYSDGIVKEAIIPSEYGDDSGTQTSMTSAYKEVLQDYSGSAEYTLYDIDKDGIHELIAYDGWEYDIYTIVNSEAVLCGSCYAYYRGLYSFGDNGLIVHEGGTGNLHLEYVNLYVLLKDSLECSENVINTEESSMDDLYKCLEGYTKIEDFYSVSDYSLLENG